MFVTLIYYLFIFQLLILVVLYKNSAYRYTPNSSNLALLISVKYGNVIKLTFCQAKESRAWAGKLPAPILLLLRQVLIQGLF